MNGTSLDDLPRLAQEAARRRQKLRDWQSGTEAAERTGKAKLDQFQDGTSEPLQVEHPLAAQVPGGAKLQDEMEREIRQMVNARDAAQQSRAEQAALTAKIKEVEAGKATLLMIGWLLVILIIGIYLIIRASDKTELNTLRNELANKQRDEENALQAMLFAKERAQALFAKLAQASREQLAAAFRADGEQWRSYWGGLPPFLRGEWSESAWREQDFKTACRLPVLLAGLVKEAPARESEPFVLPFFAPFIGAHTALLFAGPLNRTLPLFHGLILQLAAALPYQATFTLLDPSGAGRAFPMQRSLPFVRRIGADLYRDLEGILEDITRLIHTYVDDRTKSFEELPDQIQANERYEFIFAANFPDGFDRRTIEALQRIAKNGPVAGKYLFLQQSPEKELPKDLQWEDFGEIWMYNLGDPPKGGDTYGQQLQPLASPGDGMQSKILALLASAKPPETNVAFSDLVPKDPRDWWREKSSIAVSAPVGSSGRERHLNIWFGVRDGRPCAHGVLGAMPGQGKSNLYHVLICGLATRYSPEELNLYLIDGKFGVEFSPYRRLPQARVVALHSAPELSRSVLEELLGEMKRRNEIFKKAGVSDLASYHDKGCPAGLLPRVLLLIDEYQELFEDDRAGRASEALLQLAQQGRSAGLHMLLGSQRFGAQGMLHQAAIFGSMHLRMAMKMSQSDVQGLTEFGRNGKRLVEQCDMPGKIVINDQSGEDKSNEFGKVAWLSREDRTEVLDRLEALSARTAPPQGRFATVVFDGDAAPNFCENPQVAQLMQGRSRPTEREFRDIAVKPAHQQGLGAADWFAGERPLAWWLGQELNVHGQARLILRRRAAENVLLAGEHQPSTYGMLAGLLCSIALNSLPDQLRLWLADRSVPGTPWEGLLGAITSGLLQPAGFQVALTTNSRDPLGWFDDWAAELDRRAALPEEAIAAEPTWLMLLAGADRLPALGRVQNRHGGMAESPEGEKLKRLYREGPALGCHLVLTFPAGGPLRQALDRSQFDQFKHRIATQMSEEDSFILLAKEHAAKLQHGDGQSTLALYRELAGGGDTRFKPYVSDAQIPWPEQIQAITTHLEKWKETSHVNG